MSLEKQICPTPEAAQEFKILCQNAFNSPSGKKLLKILCEARHPLAHLPGMSDHMHGNCEVVALLWRYGAEEFVPPEM